ncbi:condensation domain-containing protein [Micromonospora sp. CPCC 206060]|uniref:condensation domain-containing protein n=1 Tax=Micromonospora sp. CPCC 206060 TaxID=3122406 RepID=UPI002FF2778C
MLIPQSTPATDPAQEEPTYAEFQGGRSRSGPITWGQRAVWLTVDLFRSPQAFVNLRRVLTVSARADVDVPRALRALGALVSRHESLRTRVRLVDGELRQEAADRGRLPVRVHAVAEVPADPDGRAAAELLTWQLGDPRFDHTTEWPIRAALVTVDGRVRQVVVVFSHSTVDFHATETVLRDLRMLVLRGSVPGPPGLQSLDVAEREQQTERRRSDRSVAYWVRHFPAFTVGLFEPVGSPTGPRFRRGSLFSSAGYDAVRLIAARHGVSSSTVLLAATAAVTTAMDGQDVCGIVTMANNRFPPQYDTAVSKLNQFGICRIDLADRPDFAALLPRAEQAALDAYRHAYYDPDALAVAFAELGHDSHWMLAPFCYLNDIRLPHEPGSAHTGPDEATLRAAAARSTFRWLEELDGFVWRCRIQIVDAPGAVELVITVDTWYLPADRAERLLRTVEALLVEAAFRAVPWPWSPT